MFLSGIQQTVTLTLKAPIASGADSILKYLFLIFLRENNDLHFLWIICLAEIHIKYQALFSSRINPCPAEPGYAMLLQITNSVEPDQLASSEANWSGSALFLSLSLNLYQQPGSSNLIGWQIELGVAS